MEVMHTDPQALYHGSLQCLSGLGVKEDIFAHEFQEPFAIGIRSLSAQFVFISSFEDLFADHLRLFTLVERLQIVDYADLVAPFSVLAVVSGFPIFLLVFEKPLTQLRILIIVERRDGE